MLKKLTLLLLVVVLLPIFISCDDDSGTDPITYIEVAIQTDWSGGDGQSDIVDSTMFSSQVGIDFATVPGQLTLGDYYSTADACEYNGKMYVGVTGYGTFEYDPGADIWKLQFANHYWRYSYVFDGKLYTLSSGVGIKVFDGTSNDYGLGPNGWAECNINGLPAYGEVDPYFNIFDFTEFNNELYVCGGMWNGTTQQSSGARVYKFNGATWEQVGQQVEQSSNAIAAYDGELYLGTHWSGDLYKFDGTNTWVNTGHSFGMSVTDLVVYNSKLYIGSWTTSYMTGYVDEFDGTTWPRRYSGEGVTEMIVHDNKLTWGTDPGGKIIQYDGTTMTETYDLNITNISGLVSLGTDLYSGCGFQSTPNVRNNIIYKNGIADKKLLCCYLISSDYSVLDTDWGNLVWNSDEPVGTGIEFWLEGKDPGTIWSNTDWTKIVKDTPIGLDGKDMRYKVYLWSTEDGVTPTLQDVSLKFEE